MLMTGDPIGMSIRWPAISTRYTRRMAELDDFVTRFSEAPPLDSLPDVIDVVVTAPLNPDAATQLKFVGSFFEAAYREAAAFIGAVDSALARLSGKDLGSIGQVLDFGSGWGRISRMLLASNVKPTKLFAVDVDPLMTGLISQSLPGINSLTCDPFPPSALSDNSMDAAVAFSVFSHLAPAAHEAWAKEFGRVVRSGGLVAITILEENFFDQVASAKREAPTAEPDSFSVKLAQVFTDVEAARREYKAGKPQFAGTGGGDNRDGSFYGWTACPRSYVESVWGSQGFIIHEWHPTGELFDQALVILTKDRSKTVANVTTAAKGTASRIASSLPSPVKKVLRKARSVVRR